MIDTQDTPKCTETHAVEAQALTGKCGNIIKTCNLPTIDGVAGKC